MSRPEMAEEPDNAPDVPAAEESVEEQTIEHGASTDARQADLARAEPGHGETVKIARNAEEEQAPPIDEVNAADNQAPKQPPDENPASPPTPKLESVTGLDNAETVAANTTDGPAIAISQSDNEFLGSGSGPDHDSGAASAEVDKADQATTGDGAQAAADAAPASASRQDAAEDHTRPAVAEAEHGQEHNDAAPDNGTPEHADAAGGRQHPAAAENHNAEDTRLAENHSSTSQDLAGQSQTNKAFADIVSGDENVESARDQYREHIKHTDSLLRKAVELIEANGGFDAPVTPEIAAARARYQDAVDAQHGFFDLHSAEILGGVKDTIGPDGTRTQSLSMPGGVEITMTSRPGSGDQDERTPQGENDDDGDISNEPAAEDGLVETDLKRQTDGVKKDQNKEYPSLSAEIDALYRPDMVDESIRTASHFDARMERQWEELQMQMNHGEKYQFTSGDYSGDYYALTPASEATKVSDRDHELLLKETIDTQIAAHPDRPTVILGVGEGRAVTMCRLAQQYQQEITAGKVVFVASNLVNDPEAGGSKERKSRPFR